MDQTVNTRQDADECAELGQGHDRSMEGAADGVVVLQLLPGVVLSLLVAQRDLVVLGVDVLHIHLDGVANGDDLRGMLDAVPAQLADVAQAVHTADQLERKIDRLVNKIGVKKFTLYVNPYVAAFINKGFISLKRRWQFKYGFGFNVIPSQKLAFLQYEFYDKDNQYLDMQEEQETK